MSVCEGGKGMGIISISTCMVFFYSNVCLIFYFKLDVYLGKKRFLLGNIKPNWQALQKGN